MFISQLKNLKYTQINLGWIKRVGVLEKNVQQLQKKTFEKIKSGNVTFGHFYGSGKRFGTKCIKVRRVPQGILFSWVTRALSKNVKQDDSGLFLLSLLKGIDHAYSIVNRPGPHILALKVRDYYLKHPLSHEGTLTSISVVLKNYFRHAGPSSTLNLSFGQHFSIIFKINVAFLCYCSIIRVNIYFLSPLVEALRSKKLLVLYIHHFRAEF